jgi:hypothetical protein
MLISISEKEKKQGKYAYKHIIFLSWGQWIWLFFSSTCTGDVSGSHFPRQHSRGRASAAACTALTFMQRCKQHLSHNTCMWQYYSTCSWPMSQYVVQYP